MTKLMERALVSAQNLPEAVQDDVARMVLSFLGEDGAVGDDEDVYELTPEDVEAVRLSRGGVERGEVATDDEVRALWRKYGL